MENCFPGSRGPVTRFLFVFRNKNHFLVGWAQFNEKLFLIEGDEWLRRTARAAAVPDTLPSLWTSVGGPRALLLSD